MRVLGIETSCDETAAAIVDETGILAQAVTTQSAEHENYGGVVPEIAARAHLAYLPGLIDRVVREAGVTLATIDAFAATTGPGLVGGLLVGSMLAKGLAYGQGKPFVSVNHLEAHALSVRLVAPVEFPFLLLLISGGHTQLVVVRGVGDYHPLGTTLDDALGEAFDKTAQVLGLGYPGGRFVEQAACTGDAERFTLPRPLLHRPGYDFSFSGLKTAVRLLAESEGVCADTPSAVNAADHQRTVADVCASFQQAVCDILMNRCARAMRWCQIHHSDLQTFVMAGGVASNQALRQALHATATAHGMAMVVPPPALCSDNAAMVAWAGLERWRLGQADGRDDPVRPVWPLIDLGPPGAHTTCLREDAP